MNNKVTQKSQIEEAYNNGYRRADDVVLYLRRMGVKVKRNYAASVIRDLEGEAALDAQIERERREKAQREERARREEKKRKEKARKKEARRRKRARKKKRAVIPTSPLDKYDESYLEGLDEFDFLEFVQKCIDTMVRAFRIVPLLDHINTLEGALKTCNKMSGTAPLTKGKYIEAIDALQDFLGVATDIENPKVHTLLKKVRKERSKYYDLDFSSEKYQQEAAKSFLELADKIFYKLDLDTKDLPHLGARVHWHNHSYNASLYVENGLKYAKKYAGRVTSYCADWEKQCKDWEYQLASAQQI